MSKATEQVGWDARDAFHRATMAVYADLGALIDILRKETDLRIALLALDGITEHRAPDRSDSALTASLKHAVGHLLESLNTVEDVRKHHPFVGSAFWRGRGIDRTWGSIGSGSYHNIAISAAEALLEPDATGAAQSGRKAPAGAASGIIRRKVIEAAMDTKSWSRLAKNLEHEYQSASLLPSSPTEKPKPAVEPIEEAHLEHPDEGNQGDTRKPNPAVVLDKNADLRQLVGWKEILPILGYELKNRRDREQVKALNESTGGPIKCKGVRGVIANHGSLLAWWKSVADQAADIAKRRLVADRDANVIDKNLRNQGVRKDEGFHEKETPNKRRRAHE